MSKKLLILGAGRSGTTLLDEALGGSKYFFACGELNYFWDAGFEKDQLCTCGEKITRCEFWRGVVDDVVAKTGMSVDEIIKLKRMTNERKYLYRIFVPKIFSRRADSVNIQYSRIQDVKFSSILNRSGKLVVIDSSKDAMNAYLIQLQSQEKPKLLHVVRDPRAVVYSRSRPKIKSSVVGRDEYMQAQGLFEASVKWTVANIASELVRFFDFPYKRIKYEDFVANPQGVLKDIHVYMDVPFERYMLENEILSYECHIALGNPGRFRGGNLVIKRDDRWRLEMSLWRKILITTLTLPLLLRYKFPIFKLKGEL